IFVEELGPSGISLSVTARGEASTVEGYCLTEQFDYAMERFRQTLHSLQLREELFRGLKNQQVNAIKVRAADPTGAARRVMDGALFGSSPLVRSATVKSIESITFEDVKAAHQRLFCPNNAIFILAGDVTVERGQELAGTLLLGWKSGRLSDVDYALPPIPQQR